MKYSDVFVPGGFPSHTYNPRGERQLERDLQEAKENLCKLVTLTGHTKSGKTVLARRVFPREEAIWIDGGTVSTADDFWSVIIDALDLFQGVSHSDEQGSVHGIVGKASAEGNAFVVKAAGEVSANTEHQSTEGTSKSRSTPSQIIALKGLKEMGTPLVVDDFHYLPKELQGQIVRALKSLIFDGLPVIIIAIPHRRYDALKVEREMTGRIRPIKVPEWNADELGHIPSTGFPLLSLELNQYVVDRLTLEALGSPHLMQEFCRAIAREHQDQTGAIVMQSAALDQLLHTIAETIGRPIFEKLARGPRQRSDRVPRKLKTGQSVDIYQLVLHGLAHLRPGLVTLEYEELRAGIRDIIDGQLPQMHEVARVLKHMARIAATDQSSTPVVDFEESDQKLHVTDPFFAYYLRWGELAAS